MRFASFRIWVIGLDISPSEGDILRQIIMAHHPRTKSKAATRQRVVKSAPYAVKGTGKRLRLHSKKQEENIPLVKIPEGGVCAILTITKKKHAPQQEVTIPEAEALQEALRDGYSDFVNAPVNRIESSWFKIGESLGRMEKKLDGIEG
jgi:hypothetical protein